MSAELIIPLVFAGLRLAMQAASGHQRHKQRLSDFEAFLLALHTESRGPTPAEVAHFVAQALEADDGLAEAIQRLKDVASS